MQEEKGTGWLCPICGNKLKALTVNDYGCMQCNCHWDIPDEDGICPICFSGLIAVGHDRVCSNPKCQSWDIGIAHNGICYALSSELNILFLDNVFFDKKRDDGTTEFEYNHYQKRYVFLNDVIASIWRDKLGLEVYSLNQRERNWTTGK